VIKSAENIKTLIFGMKSKYIYLVIVFFFLTITLLPVIVFADQPPDPGGGPGGGDPVGGGSPVGGGLIYLAIMGGLYGYHKFRLFLNRNKQ
jgi:hypothetical protein